MEAIKEILKSNEANRVLPLFLFDLQKDSEERIIFKFQLWARNFFPRYFSSPDAPFHKEIDLNNLRAYAGTIDSFTDIAFRGAAKTARTKLFLAFCVLNDVNNHRKYIKVLSADGVNSTQIVTDIYNMLVKPSVVHIYGDSFAKSDAKREETKSSFTTAKSVKIIADIVGADQRGAIMEEAKSDLILFEDFETRGTLRHATKTKAIWDNMEEARTGLARGGSAIYNCNYISEAGNVHKLVRREADRRKVLIVPIIEDGVPTWSRYTLEEIESMKEQDEDFEGERLCKPSASRDVYFNREALEAMPIRKPIKTIGDFKMFREYNPQHRYAGGHDIAGGVGLDSSTSVFIDFDVVPAQVVGTFASNTIAPEAFGDEMYIEANKFGGCLIAPENNKYDAAILKAKQLGANIYMSMKNIIRIVAVTPTTYGFNTNSLSKSTILSAFREAIDSGLIELNDEALIQEAKEYTRNDLIDREPDPRLTTRHFDLLVAACIAWHMRTEARPVKAKPTFVQEYRSEVNHAI